MRYEAEEKAKLPKGVPSAKELLAAKEAAALRLKTEEEQVDKIGLVSHTLSCSMPATRKKVYSALRSRNAARMVARIRGPLRWLSFSRSFDTGLLNATLYRKASTKMTKKLT
jgi:hypothetical protein